MTYDREFLSRMDKNLRHSGSKLKFVFSHQQNYIGAGGAPAGAAEGQGKALACGYAQASPHMLRTFTLLVQIQ